MTGRGLDRETGGRVRQQRRGIRCAPGRCRSGNPGSGRTANKAAYRRDVIPTFMENEGMRERSDLGTRTRPRARPAAPRIQISPCQRIDRMASAQVQFGSARPTVRAALGAA